MLIVVETASVDTHGREIEIRGLPYPNNPAMNLRYDISTLSEDTGLKPKVTFKDGMGRLIEDNSVRGEQ